MLDFQYQRPGVIRVPVDQRPTGKDTKNTAGRIVFIGQGLVRALIQSDIVYTERKSLAAESFLPAEPRLEKSIESGKLERGFFLAIVLFQIERYGVRAARIPPTPRSPTPDWYSLSAVFCCCWASAIPTKTKTKIDSKYGDSLLIFKKFPRR